MTNSLPNRPSDPGQTGAPIDPLERAWEEVDHSWDDDDAHRRFVELGVELGRLAEVGARYPTARGDAARAPRATKQIDRIHAVALASLTPTSPDVSARPRRVIVAVGYAVAVALVAISAYLLLVHR